MIETLANPRADLARRVLTAGQTDRAEAVYRQALSVDPKDGDVHVRLGRLLLERGDRMMMAGSIEGRMPFMDIELAALAARMPDSFHLRDGKTKAVLRSSMKGVLPQWVLSRKKIGFRVPFDEWFRTSQRDLVHDLLVSQQSTLRRILERNALNKLVERHMSGVDDNGRVLWSLMNHS